MPRRPLFACLFLLLAACAGEAPKPVTPPAATKPEVAIKPAAPIAQPLPAHLRELHGSLLTPPAGSDVELALLVVDERDRPQRLLASQTLAGTGNALPFRLRFDPQQFPGGARIELRARISQSGRLILRLPPQRVLQADSRDFGALPLVSAP
jgi:uncharacterized lipoprotein YbaY